MRGLVAATLVFLAWPASLVAQDNVQVEELQPPQAAPAPPPAPPAAQASELPVDVRAVALQAEQKYNEGDLAAAAALYRQAADATPLGAEKVRLLVTLSSLQHQLGQNEPAIGALSEALAIEPDYRVDPVVLGQSFLDIYYEAQKRAVQARARLAEERRALAVKRFQEGDVAAARELFDQVLALVPNEPNALYYLAVLDQRAGASERALAGFQKLLALRSAQPGAVPAALQVQALNSAAILYFDRGYFDDAESALTDALRLDENQSELWNNLGLARRRLGKRQEAMEAFRRAHDIDPAKEAAINNLGLAYLDASNWQQAAALLLDGTQRFPANPSLWLNLAIAQRGLGDAASAEASFGKAIELDAENRQNTAARAASYLALLQSEQGRFDRAVESARRALAWKADDAQAWTQLGLAQQGLGDLAAAQASLEKAQTLDPAGAEIVNNLGSVYYRQGEFEKARDAFQRAVAIRPDFVAAADNLDHANKKLAELQTLEKRLGLRLAIGAAARSASGAPLPGLLVISVGSPETTPAGRAKMQSGDRILRADGQALSSASDLYAIATRTPAPKAIGLELLRAGKPAKVKLKLS